jgi:hypothetical protein
VLLFCPRRKIHIVPILPAGQDRREQWLTGEEVFKVPDNGVVNSGCNPAI